MCRAGLGLKVASIGPHFGEEPMISGSRGSGAIFFSNCNLACVYCQNYQISQEGKGEAISPEELAEKMIALQAQGCHNINLVSPTHYGPQVIETLLLVKQKGLKIPVVYNSNGYESVEMLQMFEGLIDIYLPDVKYADDALAFQYSGINGYVAANRAAITEMYRQVRNLEMDNDGVALKGMLVRHLVLPEDVAGTGRSLEFLASVSKDIWLSLMSQYHPRYKAAQYGSLKRKLTPEEYKRALDAAIKLGFENILGQEMESSDQYLPDFEKANPFESN